MNIELLICVRLGIFVFVWLDIVLDIPPFVLAWSESIIFARHSGAIIVISISVIV